MLIHAVLAWQKEAIEGDEQEEDRAASGPGTEHWVSHNCSHQHAAEQHQPDGHNRLDRMGSKRVGGPFKWRVWRIHGRFEMVQQHAITGLISTIIAKMTTVILLTAAIFALAILYSSVGHAGASGYLAAMAIVTVMPQEEMKAVALTLNIFVGAIGSYRFMKAGHFRWSTFWPFAACAVPLAFVGGLWELPPLVFKPLIGVVLVYAAIVLAARVFKSRNTTAPDAAANTAPPRMPTLPIAMSTGGALGLLAGLTGTGGGIFLSPLLLLANWASPQRTAAVSVVFVLVNSVAGLGGVISDGATLPSALPYYAAAAITGGLIGSGIGAKKLPGDSIRLLLALVLLIGAAKMFITAVSY